ncbi:hypothetical protein [Stieleria maiorica]|nr:hypothetical protein [Stieleria maiorica]
MGRSTTTVGSQWQGAAVYVPPQPVAGAAGAADAALDCKQKTARR